MRQTSLLQSKQCCRQRDLSHETLTHRLCEKWQRFGFHGFPDFPFPMCCQLSRFRFLGSKQKNQSRCKELPPSQENFLLPDDDPAVTNYLEHLQAERAKDKKKLAEQADAGVAEKSPAWISLHMQLAEKRALALGLGCRVLKIGHLSLCPNVQSWNVLSRHVFANFRFQY